MSPLSIISKLSSVSTFSSSILRKKSLGVIFPNAAKNYKILS